MAQAQTNYDSPWKEILELYFPQFLAFFFPRVYQDVGWSRPHEFLDMELPPMLEQQFAAELATYQEEQRMRYVTTLERMAEQRGLEQGIEQGIERGAAQTLRENIGDALSLRFQDETANLDLPRLLEPIQGVPALRRLFYTALTASSFADFEQMLKQLQSKQKETSTD